MAGQMSTRCPVDCATGFHLHLPLFALIPVSRKMTHSSHLPFVEISLSFQQPFSPSLRSPAASSIRRELWCSWWTSTPHVCFPQTGVPGCSPCASLTSARGGARCTVNNHIFCLVIRGLSLEKNQKRETERPGEGQGVNGKIK